MSKRFEGRDSKTRRNLGLTPGSIYTRVADVGLAAFIAQTRQKPRGQPISIHLTEVARAEVFGLQEHV